MNPPFSVVMLAKTPMHIEPAMNRISIVIAPQPTLGGAAASAANSVDAFIN
jgi:acetyl-CoA carboxylase beta subunit